MSVTRRQALRAGAGAAVPAPLGSLASAAQAPGPKAARPRVSLAVSTYYLRRKMKDEPPLPGHTQQEAIDWCVHSIEQCPPTAEGPLALTRHQPRHRQPSG